MLADITSGGDGDDSLWGDLYADTDGRRRSATTSSPAWAMATPMSSISATATTLIADNNESILGDGFVTLDTDPDVLELRRRASARATSASSATAHDLILVIGAGGDRVTLQGQDDYFHTGVFGAISYNRIEEIRLRRRHAPGPGRS